jgi:hypothetical protein
MCEGDEPGEATVAALADYNEQCEPWAEPAIPPPELPLRSLEKASPARAALWLAASPFVTGKDPSARRRLLLVRDAVGQLCRAVFELDSPRCDAIFVHWDPTITPIVLDVASAFGKGHGPLVQVHIAAHQQANDQEIIDLLDWPRAELVLVTPQATFDARRTAMMQRRSAIRAAVVVGGDDEVENDAAFLAARYVPTFAVASTGGAAEKLFARDRTRYSGGGAFDEEALAGQGSYIVLMREIMSRLP